MNTVATILGIILGSGAIGSGLWRLACGAYRLARGFEQFAELVVELLHDHHQRLTTLENPWPPLSPPPHPMPGTATRRPAGT